MYAKLILHIDFFKFFYFLSEILRLYLTCFIVVMYCVGHFFSHIRAILFSFQEVVLHITNHDKEISVYFWSSYSRVVIGMKGNSIAEIIHYQRTEKPPKC